MKEVRYCVKNFWVLKDFKSTWYYNALQKCCIPVEDPVNPQLVISSIFGNESIPSNAKNLLIIGESKAHCPAMIYNKNIIVVGHRRDADIRFNVPFFKDTPNEFYAIINYLKCIKPNIKPDRFCASVISNGWLTDDYRDSFMKEFRMSGHFIDGGGGLYNTIGYRIPFGALNKIAYLSNYKFNIAMENSLEEGYHTEKILEGLAAGVPIYYGGAGNLDWLFERFNEKSFIYSTNISDTIEQIDKINSNDSYFLDMRNQNPLLDESLFDREIGNLYNGVRNLIDSI